MKETENHPAQARAKLDGVNIVNVVNVYVIGSVMRRGEPVIYDRRSSGFLKIRNEVTKCRGLGRSLDRPERLQRRRKGEPVPPPVSAVRFALGDIFLQNEPNKVFFHELDFFTASLSRDK